MCQGHHLNYKLCHRSSTQPAAHASPPTAPPPPPPMPPHLLRRDAHSGEQEGGQHAPALESIRAGKLLGVAAEHLPPQPRAQRLQQLRGGRAGQGGRGELVYTRGRAGVGCVLVLVRRGKQGRQRRQTPPGGSDRRQDDCRQRWADMGSGQGRAAAHPPPAWAPHLAPGTAPARCRLLPAAPAGRAPPGSAPAAAHTGCTAGAVAGWERLAGRLTPEDRRRRLCKLPQHGAVNWPPEAPIPAVRASPINNNSQLAARRSQCGTCQALLAVHRVTHLAVEEAHYVCIILCQGEIQACR
jgi:hypothetical protein